MTGRGEDFADNRHRRPVGVAIAVLKSAARIEVDQKRQVIRSFVWVDVDERVHDYKWKRRLLVSVRCNMSQDLTWKRDNGETYTWQYQSTKESHGMGADGIEA